MDSPIRLMWNFSGKSHPDNMTFTVDWALKNNYPSDLSILIKMDHLPARTRSAVQKKQGFNDEVVPTSHVFELELDAVII